MTVAKKPCCEHTRGLPFMERFGYSIKEASRLSGLSRSYLYKEISAGRLLACKAGRRTLIRVADLNKFIDRLVPVLGNKQ